MMELESYTWDFLMQLPKKEENTKRSYKKSKGNTWETGRSTGIQSRSEKKRLYSSETGRSTGIQSRSEKKRLYSSETGRSTGIHPQSSFPKKILYSSEFQDNERSSSYHRSRDRSPHRRQDSYSSEDSSTERNRYRSPYERQESRSPERPRPSYISFYQPSDRKQKQRSRMVGTEENVSDLIWLVHKFAYIWDQKNPSFKDKTKKRNTWRYISDMLGILEEDCKKLWQNLRRRYFREMKKQAGSIDSEFKKLMDTELIFLDPRYREPSINEVSQSADAQRWESIMMKLPSKEACIAFFRLHSMTAQNQTNAQSPPSKQSQNQSITQKTTSGVSTAAPISVKPSSSSSINERSTGTTSQASNAAIPSTTTAAPAVNQSPPSKQSQNQSITQKTTSGVSTAAPISVKPSSSSSINERSTGTTSQASNAAIPATTTAAPAVTTSDNVEKNLERMFSGIHTPENQQNPLLLNTLAESLLSANEREARNPSPPLNVRPDSERNGLNKNKWLTDAIAANFERFSPHLKDSIKRELFRIDPNYYWYMVVTYRCETS